MKATILFNREFIPLYHHLVLACQAPVRFEPGQFAMIGFEVIDPFLPRAFSIYKAKGKRQKAKGKMEERQEAIGTRHWARVEFLYKIIGKGSTYLSKLKPGDQVEVLAPLGNSFLLPKSLRTAILIAGGIGVPPIAALAERIAEGKRQKVDGRSRPLTPDPRPPIQMVAFIGGRSKEDVLCVRDFKRAGAEVHTVTEDGSTGQKGLVTDVLDQYLLTADHWSLTTIYACGPNAMLAAMAGVADTYNLPCQVSMEATMACGFGACMGCAIPVKPSAVSRRPSASYKLCCKDGPVFDAGEIAW